jgi:hypothetical protein
MSKSTKHTNERGAVLIVVLAASLMIAGLSYGFLLSVATESVSQRTRTEKMQAIYIAEAATSQAVVLLVPTMESGTTVTMGVKSSPREYSGGTFWLDVSFDADDNYTVVAHAKYGKTTIALETRWGSDFHALRDYAVYSGNRSELAGNELILAGTYSDRDIVEGKIYVDGSIQLTGDSEVDGDTSATGTITGNAVDGGSKENAARIEAPDLAAMDYANIADLRIDASTSFDGDGRLPSTDPRHIFIKEFRDDLADHSFTFDNTNYFFADPWEGSDGNRVSVSSDGNNKIYYIDGNVWIEPWGTVSRIVDSPADGTKITVVVRGNVYFADALAYDNAQKDAIMFVALTDGESYADANDNNQYDVGERILHDDGNGIYDGPAEGSGNIFFGDPNGGPLGHVNAFMYADNFFEDHVLDGPNGDPIPFEVTGFMSAGEQVQIKREFDGEHAQMKVNFDERIAYGDMIVPGFPEMTSKGELGRLSWRLIQSDG